MKRLVVDTNVFLSFLIRTGDTLAELIKYVDEKSILLQSAETISELKEVLLRDKFRKYILFGRVNLFLAWAESKSEEIIIDQVITGSRDLDDNKFLELAVCGKADYLITGDKDLLVLGQIETTSIVTPADFLRVISH